MSSNPSIQRVAGSFRDPSGTVFQSGSSILRTVEKSYIEDYRFFIESGLRDDLLGKGRIVPFEEIEVSAAQGLGMSSGAAAYLRVEKIPFISYPYEWSFQQLKEAALLTLRIQEAALERGMMLKDASAYNVQFRKGRPVFIDLLSFERTGDKPWPAYGQFCSHFLAPLALMAHRDLDMGLMLLGHIDGIPLELASKLLPFSTRFNLGLQVHIHTHARYQSKHRDGRASAEKARALKSSVRQKQVFVRGLIAVVEGLRRSEAYTEWGDYYNDTNYNDAAFAAKKNLISELSGKFTPNRVLDIGANTGVFSRLASQDGNLVVAADIDPVAVDKHYTFLRKEKIKNVLPLRVNLVNPAPAIGWGNSERESFLGRCDFDLVMALALIHHLAISNNVPLPMLAETFARMGSRLLIEFVPKEDSQVKRLLLTREDIFPDYHVEGFLAAFGEYFTLLDRRPIPGTCRELFVFEKK